MSPPIPERIGRYRVIGHAGSGGFASVFKAVDERLDSTVAVKLLADNWLYTPEVHRRFRDEAVLARRLTTEHGARSLVQVFDIDQTETGQPYFVMEWAAGGTLAQRRRPAGWSVSEVAPVAKAVAQGMADLHSANVVHRDITPSNLLVCGTATERGALLAPGERLVLGDLGLAKDLLDDRSAISLVAGTEHFAAPEMLSADGEVGPAADIYAATQVIRNLCDGDDHASHQLADFFAQGLSTDPANRPGSAALWLSAFERAVSRAGAHAERGPATESTRRRSFGGRVAALAALVVLGLFGLVLMSQRGSAIEGPGEIESGRSAVYSLPQADAAVPWVDPSGDVVVARTLTVTGRLPGQIKVSVAHDGERYERSIDIVASPAGPVIDGPDRVNAGTSATWVAANVDGQDIRWMTSTGEVASGPQLVLVPGVDFVVQVVATDANGVSRGEQMRVEVDG